MPTALEKPLSQMSFSELSALMAEALRTPESAERFVEMVNREPTAFDRFLPLERMDLDQVYGDLISRSTQPR